MSERTRPSEVFGIVNPASGGSAGPKRWAELSEELSARGVPTRVRETEGDGDARRWAREEALAEDAVVVAVGGDGTVQEVVDGLMDRTSRPLALAPLAAGTANVLPRALGVPDDPVELADAISEGRGVRLDVVRMSSAEEDTHFLIAAGIGWPARVIDRAPRALKDKLGVGAYVWAAIGEVANLEPSRVMITCDGETRRVTSASIIVANVGEIGGGVALAHPRSTPTDGRLDVLALVAPSAVGLLSGLVNVLVRRHREANDVFTAQGSNVRVEADPPLPIQIDGERVGHTPATFLIPSHDIHVIGARLH